MGTGERKLEMTCAGETLIPWLGACGKDQSDQRSITAFGRTITRDIST